MRKNVRWLSVLLAAVLFLSSVNTVSAAPAESVEAQQVIQEDEGMQQPESDNTDQAKEEGVEPTEDSEEEEGTDDTSVDEKDEDKESNPDDSADNPEDESENEDSEEDENEGVEEENHSFIYTDNEDGTHTSVCEECGEQITEEHSFEDDVCVCGAIRIAEEEVEEVSENTLLLEETIEMQVNALSGDIEDSEAFLVKDGTTIKGLNDEGKNQENLQLVIPEGITAISFEAFKKCTNITSVVLPESLVDLKERAFWGCSSLKRVEIKSNKIICGPNSNKEDYGAFKGCAIEEVVFGDNVTAIPEGLFCGAGFKAGTKVEIPDRITGIGKFSFYYSGVGDVILSEDSCLDSIGESAFEHTNVTIGTIPDHVRTIGFEAFRECTNITSVVLPESLVDLKERAFWECNSLKRVEIKSNKIISGPNSNKEDYGAFKGCAIEEVVFGDNVTAIPDGLFCGAGFKADTIVEIPSTVSKIGKFNFNSCSTWMREVTLPSSITLIGDYAFDGSKNYVKYRVVSGSYAHNWAKSKGYDIITVNGISYSLNGGGRMPEGTYPKSYESGKDEEIGISEAARTGYLFAGWYTDKSLTRELPKVSDGIYDITGYSDSITLYAKWTPVKYTIKFNENKPETAVSKATPTILTDKAAVYDQNVTLYNNKNTYTKYTFVEWNTKADGTGTKYKSGAVVKNLVCEEGGEITLYGIWKAGTYSVRYDSNTSGTGAKATGAMKNSVFTFDKTENSVAGNLYKLKGYKFLGWSTRADGKGLLVEDAQEVGNLFETAYAKDTGNVVTLYARWEQIPYTVTLYKNDGTTSEELATINVEYGQKLSDAINLAMLGEEPEIQADALNRDGYTLVSWNTLANGKGKKYAVTASNLCAMGEEISLYAQWSGPLTYKVTYDLAGGKNNSKNPRNYKYSLNEDKVLMNPTKTGYTFAGWKVMEGEFSNTDEGIVHMIPRGTYGNVKLQAQWTENKYKVVFHGANENYSDIAEDYIAESEGYGYSSQYVDTLSAANHYEVKQEIADKVGIMAWTTKPNGKGKSYSVGTKLTKLSADNFDNETGKGIIHLYAKWGNARYEIAYDLDGGVNHKSNPAVYEYSNKKAVTIKNPTKPGYLFEGWSINGDEDKFVDLKIPKETSGKLTLKANWTPINYTVQIKLNHKSARAAEGFATSYNASIDGSGDGNVTSFKVKDGEEFLLVNPGYTLTGFNTAANGKGISAEITPDGKVALTNLTKATSVGKRGLTVTLYAQWKTNTYNITYVNIDPEYDGSSEDVPTLTGVSNKGVVKYNVNQTVSLKNPSRYGFVFQGWYWDKACTQKVTRIGKGTTGDITLYGKWRVK
ncbi:MAG: InlB B-repeat-containing protein [Lachnospiraceae bacterium]|nr:InlB B-repeat-containing protein [Lachnospiraceae bacterium]